VAPPNLPEVGIDLRERGGVVLAHLPQVGIRSEHEDVFSFDFFFRESSFDPIRIRVDVHLLVIGRRVLEPPLVTRIARENCTGRHLRFYLWDTIRRVGVVDEVAGEVTRAGPIEQNLLWVGDLEPERFFLDRAELVELGDQPVDGIYGCFARL
jgi:hypothetical protein